MLANKSLKALRKQACTDEASLSAFSISIFNQMLQLFLIPYIPVRNTDEDKLISIFDSKKSFALTFKHLFSAINIILKQFQYLNRIYINTHFNW